MVGQEERISGRQDGTSIAHSIFEGKPQRRSELIVSQGAHGSQRAVRFDKLGPDTERRWLCIKTYYDGFHSLPKHVLFDLTHDPFHPTNPAESQMKMVCEAAFKLSEWHDDEIGKMALNVDRAIALLWTVVSEANPSYAQTLRGNDQHAEALEAYLDRLDRTGLESA